jgi:hypothetical protein
MRTSTYALIQPFFNKKPGVPSSKKIRAVCKKCNETWMSNIEEISKPVLTPLILGEKITLSVDDQQIIATWLALKTIIGDQDDQKTSSIHTESHNIFYQTRLALDGWKIWIGHYEGADWKTRYRHHGGATASLPIPAIISQTV